MAARTCIYADPKKLGDGPRLYMTSNHGWVEDPQRAVEFSSLSSANRPYQVPIGYSSSQTILAEAIKVHPAIFKVEEFTKRLAELLPVAVIETTTPSEPRGIWGIQVTMPPEKRSLTVEYRHWKGFVLPKQDSEGLHQLDDALLWALTLTEPIACSCGCHGPSAGFYHCFGPVCCNEPDVPRTNVDREARAGVEPPREP